MSNITNINQLDLNKVYTYADYLIWKFEERVELLKGKIFKMSPAPSTRHQKISMNLSGELYISLQNGSCQLFSAPFDVRLPKNGNENEQIHTVVQPDLCIICDKEKLDEKGCLGAPDLIIEILSPGNSKKEMKYKFELYQEAKVKEYWVVHPLDELVFVYFLTNESYELYKHHVVDDFVVSKTFPNIKIHTDKIFK